MECGCIIIMPWSIEQLDSIGVIKSEGPERHTGKIEALLWVPGYERNCLNIL